MYRAVIALLIASSTALAAPKPKLSGSFEMVSAKTKKDPEQQFAPMLLKAFPDAVWARMYLTFEGDDVTIGTRALELKDGVYTACGAAATTHVTWSAKGFTIASKINAVSDHTTFKKLTPGDEDHLTTGCNASIGAGVFIVGKAGDRVTLTQDDGTIVFLAPIDDAAKPNWRAHVPPKPTK